VKGEGKVGCICMYGNRIMKPINIALKEKDNKA
jgi:hypothetical protein